METRSFRHVVALSLSLRLSKSSKSWIRLRAPITVTPLTIIPLMKLPAFAQRGKRVVNCAKYFCEMYGSASASSSDASPMTICWAFRIRAGMRK